MPENKEIKKVTSIKAFPSYENSPFNPNGLVKRYIKTRPNAKRVIDTTTGELGEYIPAVKGEEKIVDELEFRKVFVKSFENMLNFSIPAFKIWLFLMSELKINSTEVVCEVEAAKLFTKYKSNLDVYKGLTVLLRLGIIARKVGYGFTYFINPNAFFNGRRNSKQVLEDQLSNSITDEELTYEVATKNFENRK